MEIKAVRYKKREDKNGEIADRKEGEKGRGGERIREGEERKKEEGNERYEGRKDGEGRKERNVAGEWQATIKKREGEDAMRAGAAGSSKKEQKMITNPRRDSSGIDLRSSCCEDIAKKFPLEGLGRNFFPFVFLLF